MAAIDAPAPSESLPGPFEEQVPFLWNDKTYYGYVSGVGAGKTFAGILRTALNVEHWNPGEMGAIVAPTTTMIKDVILPQMRDFGLLDRWEYKSPHTDEPGINAPNGARILILSADNRRTTERLAGLNLAWFWIDEASRVNQRAHEILTQRLRVGQYRNGYLTTTPLGRDYIYDTFVGGVEGEVTQYGQADVYEADDRLAILRVPTFANPYTPEDYKEQIERDHEGQVYEQEVLGRFVKFEGLVYRWFDRETHVGEYDIDQADEYVYGVDFGHSNPTAIVCLAREGDRWTVTETFYERRLTDEDLAKEAVRMVERNGEGRFYCDSADPGAIHAFRNQGLSAQGAVKDITPGIKTVSGLRDEIRVDESCQPLITEFNQYQYPEGDDAKDTPVDANNHALDALRYALHTHRKRGGSSEVKQVGSMRDLL